jgi:hypothetical protein
MPGNVTSAVYFARPETRSTASMRGVSWPTN